MFVIENTSNCDRGLHVQTDVGPGLITIPAGGTFDASPETLEQLRRNAQFNAWVGEKYLKVSKKGESVDVTPLPATPAKAKKPRTGFED